MREPRSISSILRLTALTAAAVAGLADVPILVPQGSYTDVQGDMFEAVAVRDGLVYIANGFAGLQVLDATDLKKPVRLGGVKFRNGLVRDIALMDNYAVLADWYEGMRVVDVSVPSAPTELTNAAGLLGQCKAVQMDGRIAYLLEPGGPSGSIKAIDLTVPAQPTLVGTLTAFSAPWDLVRLGKFLLVPCYYGGLKVVDIRDPANMNVVATCHFINPGATFSGYVNVAISGDYALVLANTSEGIALETFDVRDPGQPTHVRHAAMAGAPGWIGSASGCFLCTDGSGILRLFDVANVLAPRLTSTYTQATSLSRRAVAVGRTIYWPNGFAGLRTFTLEPAPLLTILPSTNQTTLRIEWGTTPGTRLQTSQSLTSPSWEDVPEALGQSGLDVPVIGGGYFRAVR